MPITLTVITLDYRPKCGEVSFSVLTLSVTISAFIFDILNIMPRWRDNGTRPLRLNRWGRPSCWCFLMIAEIWWFVFICEYILHFIPHFNPSLATKYSPFYPIGPTLVDLSNQFHSNEPDFFSFRKCVAEEVHVYAV